jgi:AcrR family transcriptional regulator
VTKGEETRNTILEHASKLATQIGLEGLSIGRLAEDLGLSKSGLFAHFASKESLQLQTLEHAAQRFVETVVKPAMSVTRGEKRVRALIERWMEWPKTSGLPGGCFFVAVSGEYDDRPGPIRDRIAQLQRDWLATVASTVRTAVAEGHFKKDVDPEQFAFELYGHMLVGHMGWRLLDDKKSAARARKAFEGLLERSRA